MASVSDRPTTAMDKARWSPLHATSMRARKEAKRTSESESCAPLPSTLTHALAPLGATEANARTPVSRIPGSLSLMRRATCDKMALSPRPMRDKMLMAVSRTSGSACFRYESVALAASWRFQWAARDMASTAASLTWECRFSNRQATAAIVAAALCSAARINASIAASRVSASLCSRRLVHNSMLPLVSRSTMSIKHASASALTTWCSSCRAADTMSNSKGSFSSNTSSSALSAAARKAQSVWRRRGNSVSTASTSPSSTMRPRAPTAATRTGDSSSAKAAVTASRATASSSAEKASNASTAATRTSTTSSLERLCASQATTSGSPGKLMATNAFIALTRIAEASS
mmetsp:Transcript_63587/g.151689  ORF Transcript_63587/g.151689 Transcript_63587/m.151689 type:complete len:346 (+) Transcript_63587:481-1518(+)